MGKKLFIVESPAKAKTIGKYLGDGFIVKSSVGHIRDLPKGNGAVAIAPEGDGRWRFTPKYEISDGKKKIVAELKGAVENADEIYLASDPDREGEAIAWHLREVLARKAGRKPFRRVTYNEITKTAVTEAVGKAHEIDMPLVDAQQARRILDRLVGYKVSPLLWKYVSCPNSRTLSAGRVQTVALRLLVERQREIDAFKPETYFVVGAEAAKREAGAKPFTAKLSRIDGEKRTIPGKEAADALLRDLEGAMLETVSLKAQAKTRRPPPPFTTSTLQQAASSALGYSPGTTMKLAQSLYEHGLITYMRTDSVNVSAGMQAAAAKFLGEKFGREFCPEKPNFFKTKDSAQAAHEAIRPTAIERTPESAGLDGQERRLYDLIWRRFAASQMSEAKTTLRTAVFEVRKQGLSRNYAFSASATSIDFPGFLAALGSPEKKKNADDDSDEVAELPDLARGELLDVKRWLSEEKQTKGPKNYSEASLVKALEENGVGRPSTYAATIETLKTRGYAETEKTKIVPTQRGILVCDWLVSRLDALFNVGYTAEMEKKLDEIEGGSETMDSMLSSFYSGFTKALEQCAEPGPGMEKFNAVFALLDQIKEWNPPRKSGRRTYDDREFVKSVKDQAAAGRRLSAKQLDSLAKLAMSYSAQIPDVAGKLEAAGLAVPGQNAAEGPQIDPNVSKETAGFCFAALDRLAGFKPDKFISSLRSQFERGRILSARQIAALVRSVLEKTSGRPDAPEIAERLKPFAAESDRAERVQDPAIPALLALFDGFAAWREPVKRGARTYDDKAFCESLKAQYVRSGSLSPKQFAALKKLAASYAGNIDGFAEKTAGLGIEPAKKKRFARKSGRA